jgi:hypothetical protein
MRNTFSTPQNHLKLPEVTQRSKFNSILCTNKLNVVNEEEEDMQKLNMIVDLTNLDKTHQSVKFRMSEVSEVNNILNIDNFEFNIFQYTNEYGRENVLINLSDYIFNRFDLFKLVNVQRFEMFIDKIRVGYNSLISQ